MELKTNKIYFCNISIFFIKIFKLNYEIIF